MITNDDIDQWEMDQSKSKHLLPTKIRTTKTLLKIKNDNGTEVEFYQDSRGEVRIKISSWYETEDGAKYAECNKGHQHLELDKKKFAWFEERLSRPDVEKLIEFLKRGGWPE